MDNFIQSENNLYLEDSPGIKLYECNFNHLFYSDALFSHYNIQFPASLKKSVVKRKSEFLAGRYACKKNLELVGVENSNVGIGTHRVSVWPNGIKGSITHTDSTALCAISDNTEVASIGIDRECWVSQQVSREIKKYVISPVEEKYLLESDIPFDKALTVIFSAKESFFKALFPFVKQYFDFDSVKVVSLSSHDGSGHFKFKLNNPIFDNFTYSHVDGAFFSDDKCVTTTLIIPSS